MQISSQSSYYFVRRQEGNKGFAISSGDDRITDVYAYVENGSLADTSYILRFKAAIRNIEGTSKADLKTNMSLTWIIHTLLLREVQVVVAQSKRKDEERRM